MASAEAEIILKLKDETAKGFEAVISHLKEMDKAAKESEKTLGAIGKGFADFGSGLAGGFGIGLGFMTAQKAGEAFASALTAIPNAIGASVSKVLELGGHLADMAAKTGIGVEALQKLQFAGSLVGVGLDTITAATTKLQAALVDTPEKFERIGLSAQALRGMDVDQQMVAIGNAIKGIEDPALRASVAVELLGKGGAAMMPLLTSAMGDAMAEAERLGIVLGADVVGAADDLGDTLDTLSQVWDGLTNNIGAAVVQSEPLHVLLKGLIEILGSLSKAVSDNRDGFRSFVDSAVIFVADALVLLSKVVAGVSDIWMALKVVWETVAAQARVLANDVGLLDAVLKGNISVNDALAKSYLFAQEQFKKRDDAVKAEIEAANSRAAVIGTLTDKLQKLRDATAAAAGQTHIATEETKANTTAVGLNQKQQEEAEKAAAKRAKDILDIQIATAKSLKKVSDDFFKEEERKASENGKRLAARLKEVNEREEDRAKAAQARAEAEQKELEDNFQAARDLAAQFIELGEAVGGAFGAILQLGGAGVVILQNLDHQAETSAEKMAAAGNALGAAVGAFQSGSAFKGALGGAAAGAQFGLLGAGIGAVAGGLLGLFGKAAKARKELEKMRGEVLQQFGGMTNLKKAAESVGISIEKAFTTKSPEEAKRIFDSLNKALEEKQKRLDGIATAISGLELITKGFAAQMERAGEATASSQAAFSRLGNFAVATFAGLVRETGDVIGALQSMGPSLDQLGRLMADFGFQASGAFARLLQLREIVTANEDIANSISGLNQLIKGMGDAGLISRDILLDLGAQASANFDELIARGVDANAALALMQPTLQELWERQKQLGVTYDDNTEALLRQAEQQGLVGDAFLDTNEQMLEVLKILVETLGGELPAALQRMGTAAEDQFGRMGRAAEGAADAAQRAGHSAGFSGESEGSFATGIREVPRTMVAKLHTGEEVVPASDRGARRRQFGPAQVIILQSAPVLLDGRKVGMSTQRRIEAGDIAPKSLLRRVR